jgi:D-alanyl-D-alanine carboxypeptidase/D-alanyl-D-alanine-endopeptidase (penicillin-binding protein 4)
MWSRLLTLACALLLLPAPALAGAKKKIAALAPSGLVLVMDDKGNELVAQNADEPFVPASVTKIVTAWLAMEVLGADYRFETSFYLDGDRKLYVRGGGDPFLISEELAPLAKELVAAIGKEPITGIVLDASYYPSDLRIPGIENTSEAYDALNSALAVNFNTISAVRKGKTVRSAEEQTPITPLAISQFRARGPQGRGRISLSKDPAVSLKYAGELIAAFIERAGGSVKGEIVTGTVPEGLKPVYVHRQSRTLSQILTQLLIGSNNYIANQVFLEIGGPWADPSASRNRSRSRTTCLPPTASPIPSISRRAPASVATTASRRAASPSCSIFSSPMPPCSAAAAEPSSRPAPFPASAPWRATPTPPSTGGCAS